MHTSEEGPHYLAGGEGCPSSSLCRNTVCMKMLQELESHRPAGGKHRDHRHGPWPMGGDGTEMQQAAFWG